MSTARVRMHIDRLVLRGVAREQRDAVVRALENELARQLSQADATAGFQSRHAPSLPAGKLALPQDATPVQLGISTARALVRGLRG